MEQYNFKNMKCIALTYNYDLNKLSSIGRHWAKDVYGGKNFIFEYSAASYATFIDKNPKRILDIYTDDISLLKQEINKYKINQDQIKYHDFTDQLKKYGKDLKYSFDILTDFIYIAKSANDFTVKIDNDLVFYGELPEPKENDIFVWKYERKIYEGNPLMGEIKVAQEAIGTTNVNSKIWHCCEQTANNWIFHKYKYNIIETYNIVDHLFDRKQKCIEDAKYLLK